jgi:hypothetical protein
MRLLLLLLLPSLAFGQLRVRDRYYGKGTPTLTPATSQATFTDSTTGQTWRWRGTVSKWQPENNQYIRGWGDMSGGGNGRDATVTVGSVTSVSGASGTNPIVTVTDANPSESDATLNFNFVIPAGQKGDKGDPGSGSGGSTPGTIIHNPNVIETLTQIQVGGTKSNQTVSQAGATYSGITYNGTDNFDETNLRYAFYLGNLKKKAVVSAGEFYVKNNILRDSKNYYNLFWDGYYQTSITTQNNNAFDIAGRPLPADMNDANIMIMATWTIKNLTINAQSNQRGLFVNSTYHSNFENIMVWGGYSGHHFQFCLNGTGTHLRTGNSQKGITIDYLRISGATASNSQSNHFILYQSHSGGSWNGGLMDYAVASYGSSGVFVYHAIAEGLGFKRAFINDFALSPNVKTGGFLNIHAEGVLGNRGCASGDAFFFVRMSGVFLIDNPYMQFAGCFVNMGANGGWLTININNVPWMVLPGDGKYFVNTGNTFIKFKETGFFTHNTPSMWYVGAVATGDGNGVATSVNTGYNSGTNKYSIESNGWTNGIYPYNP